jgi:hypothetical protein
MEPPVPPSRVIQAYFPGGRPPAHLVTRSYPSPHGARVTTPHAATVQRAVTPHAATLPAAKPPHAATLQPPAALQKKPASPAAKPPHAATVQRREAAPPKAGAATAPHAAQRSTARALGPGEVHAFRTPDGFLDEARGRTAKELPPLVRRKMETFFEADFSDVRVHVGPEAPAIGAIAFTVGTDLYFAPGQFEPDSVRGQELLGHELTHVVQQREGRVENPFAAGVAVVQDSTLEDEADHMGRLVASQRRAVPTYRRERRSPSSRARADRSEPEPGTAPRGLLGAPAQQKKEGYQLVVGAYLHENPNLPEPLAGHAFVALEGPDGSREAWGFSPANFGEYDPNKDLGKLTHGVPGVVHDDAGSLGKPGVKTKAYPISAAQAQAARAKVAEYQERKYRFSLKDRQCSAFAVDVLDAAKIEELDGVSGRPPREMYKKL